MKTLKLLIIAMVLSVACFAQADHDTYTATAADLTAQTFTFLHAEQNTNFGLTHVEEFVWGSAPATASITITCVMRGGTTVSTLYTSTATTNQAPVLMGVCDILKTVVSWTGSPSSAKINITGSVTPFMFGVTAPSGAFLPIAVSPSGGLSVTSSFTSTDGQSNLSSKFNYDNAPSGGAAPLEINPLVFNSVGWDRIRSASSANVANAAQLGVSLVDYPAQWAIFHQPAAQVQATISQAAGATVRHVAKSVTVCISAVAAQPDIIFNLRDGATGAGTIKWTARLSAVAGTSQCQTATFTIAGTLNTAMTLESAAAPAATNFATVSISGYDIQ